MSDRKKNLITLLVTILLTYSFLEFAVWRNILDQLPLSIHKELGRLQLYAQSSKQGVRPKNYIMIIGDSYAEGLGDWLMKVVGQGNPDYNAAHIIHNLTEKDVISIGVRGGHPTFNVANTSRAFRGSNLYLGLKLSDPTDVLIYFFEGNDINDELFNINFGLPDDFDKSRLFDRSQIRLYINQLSKSGEQAAERRWHVLRNAHMFDTSTKLVKLAWKNIRSSNKNLLASTDPIFATGRSYKQDWTRYQNAKSHFISKTGPLPYPPESVEPFAFHSSEDIRIVSLFFEETVRHYRIKFPKSKLWVIYIPSPIMTYRIVENNVALRDRIRTKGNEVAGKPTEFSRRQLIDKSNEICGSIYRASVNAGAKFIDARARLLEKTLEFGYLHGPNDASHFNERGYRSLAEIIVLGMAKYNNDACQTDFSVVP